MPRPMQSLDLVFREATVPTPNREREPTLAKSQLWMAVCLPNLSFDALHGPVHEPAVVVEPLEGQVRVVAVNGRARELGIAPGSKLNAALALAASLKVLERSPRLERALLESLAAWTQTLTPTVSIELPETLLLEVSGSIKLFHRPCRDQAKARRENRRLVSSPVRCAYAVGRFMARS